MSEVLERSIAAARTHVASPWDEARSAHLVQRALARRRRRRLAMGLGTSVVAAAALALYFRVTSGPSAVDVPLTIAPIEVASAAPPEIDGALRFADGSRVTPLEDGTEVLVDAASAAAIELDLGRGAARFEVTPGLPRAFVVRAAHLSATVVGTVFVVRRRDVAPGTTDVEVEVLEGTVRIESVGEPVLLHAPQTRTFRGPAAEAPPREPTVASTRIERPTAVPDVAPEVAPAPTWRSLADEGRFDEGYALLLLDRDVLRSGDLETLLAAADCARLSSHPAEALAYLQRAAELADGDPRAALIAFTTGRVLLGPLHRPSDAAARFASARALAPEGSLASDALAREVEAWAASGDGERARTRAEEYLSRYPSGVHADAVRHHGGLE